MSTSKPSKAKSKITFLNLLPQNREVEGALQAAYARVFNSGWYILGPEVVEFEKAFAAYIGTPHCIGTGNGMDALTLILRALNIGPGDEVIVSAHTAIATWLAVSQVGATPVPVSPGRYFNIDPALLPQFITSRTKAILVVHLYGHPVDVDAIMDTVKGRSIHLVEDVAQAHGARYKGKMTGSLGIAAGFSFYPTKNLGALGDGGAVTLYDDALAKSVRGLRNYGSEQRYLHEVKGMNSRLDELQAAFLAAKLPHLDDSNARRRHVASLYHKHLADCAHVVLPETAEWATPVWHQYVIRSKQRDALKTHLEANGVETLIHYPIPNHLQKAYSEYNSSKQFASYEQMTAEVLSLPISPTFTDEQAGYVCDAVCSFKG